MNYKILIIGYTDLQRKKMKNKKNKKENLFLRLFNRILKLPYLRKFKLGIGWVKGFDVEVEFFEKKTEKSQ